MLAVGDAHWRGESKCAACCHFHFFWGRHERTAWFSDLGKILSLLAFIVSVWRMTYLVFFG